MDISTTTTLISTVGFPIAACCAMFYLLYKTQEEHKAESEKWIKALDDNTAVMNALLTKLEAGEIK